MMPGMALMIGNCFFWRSPVLGAARVDPDKAERVLAEVAGMVKERKITTSPGAAAFDLWQRLP